MSAENSSTDEQDCRCCLFALAVKPTASHVCVGVGVHVRPWTHPQKGSFYVDHGSVTVKRGKNHSSSSVSKRTHRKSLQQWGMYVRDRHTFNISTYEKSHALDFVGQARCCQRQALLSHCF